jgi:hypothetical protein
VGFWKKLIDAANFEPTFVTPLGAGHGWSGIAPVLILAVAAALLAWLASRPLPRVEGDVRRAALAVVGWGAAAFVLPWLLGGGSALDGDHGAGELIALFAGAGLACVALAALLQRRRSTAAAARAPSQLLREPG